MGSVQKRKASKELERPTKKIKLSCPTLPIEIWSAIEQEVLSVTTRAAMRSVCRLFAYLFDDRDQWIRIANDETDDTAEKDLTYQLITYCRIDGPHTLQYHLIFRRNGLASCFELGHQQLVSLFSKVGGKCDLPEFPELPTTEKVRQFTDKATYWILDGHWETGLSARTYEDRAYLWAIGPENIFLFLEFGLHSPTVRSYQWPAQGASEKCFYNQPFGPIYSMWHESQVFIAKENDLWILSSASSQYFFDPSTRQCLGHLYVKETTDYESYKLIPADTTTASLLNLQCELETIGEDGTKSRQPVTRTSCVLFYDEDGEILEEHPYPKPSNFIVNEERLFNK
jgi:hypothetical protein